MKKTLLMFFLIVCAPDGGITGMGDGNCQVVIAEWVFTTVEKLKNY